MFLYKSQISGERLQDHWFSGFSIVIIFSVTIYLKNSSYNFIEFSSKCFHVQV